MIKVLDCTEVSSIIQNNEEKFTNQQILENQNSVNILSHIPSLKKLIHI
jgi:hypothetical protein